MRSKTFKPYKQSSLRYKFAYKAKPGLTPGISRREMPPKTPAAASRQHHQGRRTVIPGVGKHWLNKPPIVMRGEREICNPATVEGQSEYKYRVLLMWVRQDGWCCFRDYDFCRGRLRLAEATFEHENKRTRGERDDRISCVDEAGKERPQNGAAHGECNRIAGSRRLPIWHGTNWLVQVEKVSA